MKRILLSLCMSFPSILMMAGEGFTIGKYTFEILSPTEVALQRVDKSLSSAYLSSTVTHNGVTYRLTSIGWWAFDGCSSLTSVTIPNSVTSIGDYAFFGCSSLTSITIPNSVTSIGDYAFYGCRSLTSITIPNSVTYIGLSVFEGCKSLIVVNYAGTKKDWKKIKKPMGWKKGKNRVIRCTDGEC